MTLGRYKKQNNKICKLNKSEKNILRLKQMVTVIFVKLGKFRQMLSQKKIWKKVNIYKEIIYSIL